MSVARFFKFQPSTNNTFYEKKKNFRINLKNYLKILETKLPTNYWKKKRRKEEKKKKYEILLQFHN